MTSDTESQSVTHNHHGLVVGVEILVIREVFHSVISISTK